MISDAKKFKKRIRESYPEKRNNYRKYGSSKWEWIEVFSLIEAKKEAGIRSYIQDAANQYNIPYSTLQRKYNKSAVAAEKNKPDVITKKEKRGGHNKASLKRKRKHYTTI